MPAIVKDALVSYQIPLFAPLGKGGTDRDMVAFGHTLYG
ncbi:hypothetical protein FHS32_004986 [Streptomyces albaduncus]|uniref:Uncharacterized protein n=1 Tax=Streptomyces griseoloalbus TaxID=67303 RepID=A0A7W8BRF1_9ACTN|nr:hypothetical protein [Streptomyces albaduncus]